MSIFVIEKNLGVGMEVRSCDTAASCGLLGTNVFITIHQSVQDACESKHAPPPPPLPSVFLVEFITHGA